MVTLSYYFFSLCSMQSTAYAWGRGGGGPKEDDSKKMMASTNIFPLHSTVNCTELKIPPPPSPTLLLWLETSVPDPPDPHVFWSPGSRSFYHQAKIARKTLGSYCFVTTFGLFIFFCTFKSSQEKNFFYKLVFYWCLKGQWENSRIRIYSKKSWIRNTAWDLRITKG